MNQNHSELTRRLLLNSNSRGVKDEVIPMGQEAEDVELAGELTEDGIHQESIWSSLDDAADDWQGRVETHEMFRRSYE
ncbi:MULTISPECIES: hypothetical protein [Paenibacillus]|uniref:hypothetical protein n=1 Tax=Paenibacillus TaxID=44249 RepID=UPI001F38B877|nr:hypothetical protein [Paenibacillus sp. JJ-223]CAH1221788.1 hypothetical protein PAECIP111890_05289 [Paenibacillus sp. JJ-223]